MNDIVKLDKSKTHMKTVLIIKITVRHDVQP